MLPICKRKMNTRGNVEAEYSNVTYTTRGHSKINAKFDFYVFIASYIYIILTPHSIYSYIQILRICKKIGLTKADTTDGEYYQHTRTQTKSLRTHVIGSIEQKAGSIILSPI